MGLASFNQVILIGCLGKDPAVHNGKAEKIVSMSLATTSYWVKDGQKKHSTQWHQCVAFGKMGEICEEFLKKGSHVMIIGSLMNVKWEGKGGEKRSGSRVRIDEVEFLDRKDKGQAPEEGTEDPPQEE